MKLTVVGMGMGAESGMTGQAHQAIEQAGLILGAERMLNAVSFGRGKKVRAVKPAQIAQALAENPERPACVVCSGDTGFYSLADSLRRSLPAVLKPVPAVHAPAQIPSAHDPARRLPCKRPVDALHARLQRGLSGRGPGGLRGDSQ